MRRAVRALVTVAFVVAGCVEPASTPPPGSVTPADAAIGAQAIAFDKATLEVPAGRPFRLDFENREGAPHNVAIVDGAGTVVFKGEVFSGPATMQYAVPALAPGAYTFLCDVHPQMTGRLTAS